MPCCVPPGLHPSLTIPALSLKILDQQPLPSMQHVHSCVLDDVDGTRKVECSLSPRSGWLDMPSERGACNVGDTIRRLCDVRLEDAELALELGLHVEFS